jgi:hypothetical protein
MNNVRHLSYNRLTFIPADIVLCQNLRILKIWHNNLQGSVSPLFEKMTNLWLSLDMVQELEKSRDGIKIYRRMLMNGNILEQKYKE